VQRRHGPREPVLSREQVAKRVLEFLHAFGAESSLLESTLHMIGRQLDYTGWLEDGVYAPHIESWFRAPANKTLLLLGDGFLARRGLKQARASGRF
jgi:hypothetical protein